MKTNSEVHKISSELKELKKEHQALFAQHQASEKQIRELEEELKVKIGANHFRRTLNSLKIETEKLRSVYPLQDLLKAKELEVEKVGRTLASINEAHSEFKALDLRLKTLIQERDELRDLAKAADDRFKRQILRIRTAGLMIPFEVKTQDASQQPSEYSRNDGNHSGSEPEVPHHLLTVV